MTQNIHEKANGQLVGRPFSFRRPIRLPCAGVSINWVQTIPRVRLGSPELGAWPTIPLLRYTSLRAFLLHHQNFRDAKKQESGEVCLTPCGGIVVVCLGSYV